MKNLFVSIFSALGSLVASSSSAGCLMLFIDEPEMSKKMIER